jgi:MerR family mercuric resistance operon transcriptional regulator
LGIAIKAHKYFLLAITIKKVLTPYYGTENKVVTMNKQKPITIGVLAKQAGVGVETVRFYERKGLITQPPKFSGYRHYSNDDVKRIRVIKKAQKNGFTLEEIKDFLSFDTCSDESRLSIRQKSQDKITEIKQKIVELNSVLHALERFSNTCGTDHENNQDCHFLDCFNNDWECCNGQAQSCCK